MNIINIKSYVEKRVDLEVEYDGFFIQITFKLNYIFDVQVPRYVIVSS